MDADMLCPMCGGDEFEEVIVDRARWMFKTGLMSGAMKIFRGVVTQHVQRYRCKKCEFIATFGRK